MQKKIISQSYKINYNNPGFNKGVNSINTHNIKKQNARTEIKPGIKNINTKNLEFPRINPIVPKNTNKKRYAGSSMDNKIESNIRINNTNDNKINIDNRLRNKQLHQSPNKIRQEPKENNNNSIINSLNDYRLPNSFRDFTFDALQKK